MIKPIIMQLLAIKTQNCPNGNNFKKKKKVRTIVLFFILRYKQIINVLYLNKPADELALKIFLNELNEILLEKREYINMN